MAFGEVTGATVQELAEMKWEYERSPKYEDDGTPFETAYCLRRIGKQPEDYDGPDRFCKNRAAVDDDGEHYNGCRFHGKGGKPVPGNLIQYPNLQHSMYAFPETIRDTLSDEEQDLLDRVLTWPDVYGIDLESDPASAHTFDTLALEIVRQHRGILYILNNYEVTTKGVYTATGDQIIGADGRPVTEDVPNSLLTAYQAELRLIESLKDSLGITRKSKKQDEQVQSATAVIDGLASALGGLVDSGSGTYDPDAFSSDEEGADS